MYKLSHQEHFERRVKWGGGGGNCQPVGWRLRLARRAAGLSLRELGDKMGMTHAGIKKYEDEEVIPPVKKLQHLAQLLNVRMAYFFQPQKIVLEGIKYRKCDTLAQKRLEAIEGKIIAQIERRIELENLFPSVMAPVFSIPPDLPVQINDLAQVEATVDAIRQSWSLGCTPISSVSNLLEKQGVRVFLIDLDERANNKFDGLVAWVNDIPIIVISKNWPGERQRFTLAHELGHLVLTARLAKGIDEEIACHQFAGALLLPGELIKHKLGAHRKSIEPKELALLKEEFGLSMVAILYRAQALGIISTRWLALQLSHFHQRGWHLKEPGNPYPSEILHSFEQLVFHALGESYISEDKAAELMNLSPEAFQALRVFKYSNDVFSL